METASFTSGGSPAIFRAMMKSLDEAVDNIYWKFIQDAKGEYLFNIAIDQAEKNNLKDTNKEIADKLKMLLSNWENSVLKPIPLQD